MNDVLTIEEFLLARIAEDEDGRGCVPIETWLRRCVLRRWSSRRTGWKRRARVEAECAAKRRIVEKVEGLGLRDDPRAAPWYQGYSFALKDVLKDLALPYADHPDYREEWRL